MPTNKELTLVDKGDPAMKGMRDMCMNILMEAEEKCEEIDVKCEEEYRFLKLKEIIEQRSKVKKMLEKRKNDVDREFRVHMTKLYNHSRLQQLEAKNNIVNQVMEEVKVKLAKERGHHYVKLLKLSMTQALYMLMEPEVTVICKKADKDVVADCLRDVGKAYEKKTLLHSKISISHEYLPDKNIGGVIVRNTTNDVSVDCLVDSRVEQVCRQAMPLIVDLLFADVKISEVPKDPLPVTSSKVQKAELVWFSAKPLDEHHKKSESMKVCRSWQSSADFTVLLQIVRKKQISCSTQYTASAVYSSR
ncbi:hypothetical protein GE061_013652 [Apolygus lucorum]|uniref:V-type proton ATPase subunit E n=1 Tax=Apolygus lucorum TaxID=248454 RepID=A0A8S9XR71_APOLU|nr:hypothetical protein GE061_013652 [Apolygus lucorum]